MKSLVLSLMLLTMSGCSSSSSTPKAAVPTTAFGKAASGSWLSECQSSGNSFYKDTLSLDGVSSGSTAIEYYNDNACTEPAGRKDAPQAFRYSSKEKSANSSRITISLNGQNVELDVTINGSVMTVSSRTGTVKYVRLTGGEGLQQAPANGQTGGDPNAMAAFDRLGIGTWVMIDCQVTTDNRSFVEILTIRGSGTAGSSYNVWQNTSCQGNPQATQENAFIYRVNRFANGGGEVEINGQALQISFPNPTTMNIVSGAAPNAYKRVR